MGLKVKSIGFEQRKQLDVRPSERYLTCIPHARKRLTQCHLCPFATRREGLSRTEYDWGTVVHATTLDWIRQTEREAQDLVALSKRHSQYEHARHEHAR